MADSFRDLIAWQKAMVFVVDVYRITSGFPDGERYGLTNQVRRAAVGIASDIAEGKGRLSKKEFVQFLAKARGSLCEVQTQLEIALRLEYLHGPQFELIDEQARELGRILNGLMKTMRISAVDK